MSSIDLMLSIALCIIAFVVTYSLSRRSLSSGLMSVLVTGYLYGIIRANLPSTPSHFMFDCAVLGLYIPQFTKRQSAAQDHRERDLRLWIFILIAWPLVLFCLPRQDLAIELVGLRGAIFFLPLLLIGSRLTKNDIYRITICLAVLNIVAFSVAAAEYFVGLESFFPHNDVTELIYRSNDAVRFGDKSVLSAYRIPSTFANAHAYGGAMAFTLIFLIGAWTQKRRTGWRNKLVVVSIFATLMGVFIASARTPFIIVLITIVVFLLNARIDVLSWALFFVLLLSVGWVVSGEKRLQRFTTLQDSDEITERVAGSLNGTTWEIILDNPIGNGLGGGGTSIPYFLKGRLSPPKVIGESEISRIVIEEGWIGLALWLLFCFWIFSRRAILPTDKWLLCRRLLWFSCVAIFLTGFIGVGLLTSIPGTTLVLLGLGWVATKQDLKVPASSKPRQRYSLRAIGEGATAVE